MNCGRLLRKFYFYNYFRTKPTYTVYSHCVKWTRSMCTCNLLQCQDFLRSPLFLKHATDIKHTQAVQSRQKSKKGSKIQVSCWDWWYIECVLDSDFYVMQIRTYITSTPCPWKYFLILTYLELLRVGFQCRFRLRILYTGLFIIIIV